MIIDLKNNISDFEEIDVKVFNFSGLSLLMGITSSLGILSYWDSIDSIFRLENGKIFVRDDCFPGGNNWLSPIPGILNFHGKDIREIKTGLRFNHIIGQKISRKNISVVRDPRDSIISSYNYNYKNSYEDGLKCDISEALDIPSSHGSGALFGLGQMEEWFLYYKIIDALSEKSETFLISFENIKQDGEKVISELLGFLSVKRTREQIINALSENKCSPIQWPTDLSGTPFKWKELKYDAVNERFNIIASKITPEGNYEYYEIKKYTGNNSKIFPDGAFKLASERWVYLYKNYFSAIKSINIEKLSNILKEFCSLIDELPLLQIYFCFLLLNTEYEEFALKVIQKFENHHSEFLKLAYSAIQFVSQPNYDKKMILIDRILLFLGKYEHLFFIESFLSRVNLNFDKLDLYLVECNFFSHFHFNNKINLIKNYIKLANNLKNDPNTEYRNVLDILSSSGKITVSENEKKEFYRFAEQINDYFSNLLISNINRKNLLTVSNNENSRIISMYHYSYKANHDFMLFIKDLQKDSIIQVEPYSELNFLMKYEIFYNNSCYIFANKWEFYSLPSKWIEIINNIIVQVWVPSLYVKESYISSGIDKKIIKVISPGVNTTIFNPEAKPVEIETNKAFKFLFIGKFIDRKGINILLEAYSEEFDENDNVCLIIKEIKRNNIENYGQISSLNPELILYTPMVEDRDRAGLYKACNCFIYPYKTESTGEYILEAMACGIPVITTGNKNFSGLEFCNEDTCFLINSEWKKLENVTFDGLELTGDIFSFEPDKKHLKRIMRQVYNNYSLTKTKADNARTLIENNYSLEKINQKIIDTLSDLVRSQIYKSGLEMFEDGKYRDTIQLLSSFLKPGLSDAGIYELIAKSLEKIGDYKTAGLFYKKIIKK